MTERQMGKRIDLFIHGGLIYDGTYSEPYEGDIGISKDTIVFINRGSKNKQLTSGLRAGQTIDAKNYIVAPGFIDTHGHSEFTLLADPRAEGKLCQGITTEINGNCGLSAAPLAGEALIQREQDLIEFDIRERWASLKEYFEILERREIPLNFVTLAGHGNIRACIMGYKDKQPVRDELKKMNALLRKTLSEGAAGISTGLIYPPGVYADTEELIELAKSCSNLIYTSHMRSEGDRLLESVQETIRIGQESGINIHISHIKTSGRQNWHKIDRMIELIEEGQRKGIKISCDKYPYTASSTDLDTVLPSWVFEGGFKKELVRLGSPDVRKKIKRQLLNGKNGQEFWENIRISTVSKAKNKWMEGKSIASIAKHRGCDPIDTLFTLLIDEKLRVGAIFFSMSETNLLRLLSLPCLMIGTDSSSRSTNGPTHKGKPHPRGFGSFPKLLGKYVRDESVMSLNEAIHRISFLPARTFGIHKRGVIKKGAFADIVIFDARKITDRATFGDPFLKPEGIHYVIVNGVTAVSEGELTGRRSGMILRHGK
jgi:N-acyl-D-amino-acid deacylase